MGEITTIPWCDHTFNPWWGCTEAGPGCANCYARESDHRWGGDHWGQGKPRRYFGDDHWREPVRWNRAADAAGQRRRVFCASMADVFDNEVDQSHRERLWALIRATPWLDWLVVTKRIPNALKMLPADWGDGYSNVWLIATTVSQVEADRDIPRLAAIPARIHGLSIEPQLEAIDLSRFSLDNRWWVICGGESGAQARPFRLDWARTLSDQCAATGTPFFMKQIGSAPEGVRRAGKGEDPAEWAEDLRVRQFPLPTVAVALTEQTSAPLPVMPLLPHQPRADDRLDTRVVSHNPSSAAAPNDAEDDRDTLVPKGKRRSDYDPDALPGHSEETMAAIRRGQEAGKALQRGETWEQWREVGGALELGVRDLMHALGINDRQQAGRRWSEPFGDWLRRYEFDWIDRGARSRLLDCMANIEAIEVWREKLQHTDRKNWLRWNHPDVIWAHWPDNPRRKVRDLVAVHKTNPHDETITKQADEIEGLQDRIAELEHERENWQRQARIATEDAEWTNAGKNGSSAEGAAGDITALRQRAEAAEQQAEAERSAAQAAREQLQSLRPSAASGTREFRRRVRLKRDVVTDQGGFATVSATYDERTVTVTIEYDALIERLAENAEKKQNRTANALGGIIKATVSE